MSKTTLAEWTKGFIAISVVVVWAVSTLLQLTDANQAISLPMGTVIGYYFARQHQNGRNERQP